MYQSLLYYVLIISCTSKKKIQKCNNVEKTKKRNEKNETKKTKRKNEKTSKILKKTKIFVFFSRFLLKKNQKTHLKKPGFFQVGFFKWPTLREVKTRLSRGFSLV